MLRSVVSGLLVSSFAFSALASAPTGELPAKAAFQQANPRAAFYLTEGRITRIYAAPFGSGETPAAASARFVESYAGLWGVAAEDLRPGAIADGRLTQPILFRPETGDYKFTQTYYTQTVRDIPVFESELLLLARNTTDYPLVHATATLRDLGDFEIADADLENVRADLGFAAALLAAPDLQVFSPAELIVFAGTADEAATARLAVRFIADNGLPATELYQRWEFVTEASNGRILLQRSMIHHTDIVGTVTGKATEGVGADPCEEEIVRPLPHALVTAGGTSVFTDAEGGFVIPNDGDQTVAVTSELRGKWFKVLNQGGSNSKLTLNVSPPGPADFVHNDANTAEHYRAEVNAYYDANVVRDMVLKYNPEYPTINSQEEFPANVNINSSCNAYYDGGSINFFITAGGCPNTSYNVVVHHEYGHHLVATAGSGQGEYGEGMSDTMGVLISDRPELAFGFLGQCDSPLRNADNNKNYPCSGGIHDCGQLISGCVWDTRNELLATNPDTYREIISNLTVNSVLLHRGTSINPQITIDFLTLDDDNGDIYDSTPHYKEIAAGFGAHKMDAPKLDDVVFKFPEGFPARLDPAGGTKFRVLVSPLAGQPLPDSGKLYYSEGGEFKSVAMQQLEENVYDAVFPPTTCGFLIDYYVSVMTTDGLEVNSPEDAPQTTQRAFSLSGTTDVLVDDFETDTGWTVENSIGLKTGKWERGIPVQGDDEEQPAADYDGSGQCFVTDNRKGNYDVDGNYTRLTSPALALSGKNVIITYARWYFSSDDGRNEDKFVISVSNDDGQNWVEAERVESATLEAQGGWYVRGFSVGQFVTPTDQVRVRFEASDYSTASRIEAGLDQFVVSTFDCGDEPRVLGDLNCSGGVDFDDIDPFVLALTSPADYATTYPDCDILLGDVNGSGGVDFDDIDGFVACITNGGCE